MTSDTTTDPNHGEPYRGVERRLRVPVLGMRFRDLDENGAAQYMLQTPRSADEGLGVFVTPNIQHIALARKDDEFNRALASAQIIVADGFPVYRFAKLRGLSLPGRVAGRAVIERMFADPPRWRATGVLRRRQPRHGGGHRMLAQRLCAGLRGRDAGAAVRLRERRRLLPLARRCDLDLRRDPDLPVHRRAQERAVRLPLSRAAAAGMGLVRRSVVSIAARHECPHPT